MLPTASGRREEDEENGAGILVGRSELHGLVRYGDHEESPIDSFDGGVRDRYAVSDDGRVKFFDEGQTVHDLALALDQAPAGEGIGKDLDHLTT